MTQRQIESLNQTRADRQPELRKACGATPHTLGQRVETTVDLLLDNLRIHQVGMGFDHRFAGASALASMRKLRDLMVDCHQGRQVGLNIEKLSCGAPPDLIKDLMSP